MRIRFQLADPSTKDQLVDEVHANVALMSSGSPLCLLRARVQAPSAASLESGNYF